jgi:hypothetical protein
MPLVHFFLDLPHCGMDLCNGYVHKFEGKKRGNGVRMNMLTQEHMHILENMHMFLM